VKGFVGTGPLTVSTSYTLLLVDVNDPISFLLYGIGRARLKADWVVAMITRDRESSRGPLKLKNGQDSPVPSVSLIASVYAGVTYYALVVVENEAQPELTLCLLNFCHTPNSRKTILRLIT